MGASTRKSINWLINEIQLLDVIVSVNGKTFSECAALTDYTDSHKNLDLHLDQTQALKENISGFIEKGMIFDYYCVQQLVIFVFVS